jgi:pimeloyl-ACP methyl ester carboxylesterase
MIRSAKHFFLFFLFVAAQGCVSNYVFTLTDRQIEERYKNKPQKPLFHNLKTETGNVHYVSNGDSSKPLLVLIHGAPGHWYSSMNLMEDADLLNKFFIISLDRPGYGKSNNGYSIPYIDAQADVIHQIVTRHNKHKQKITLVGRSYGTAISARYAMMHPENVQKLFLLASCVAPQKEKYFWFSFANLLHIINMWMPNDLNSATVEKFKHKKQLKYIENDWDKIIAPTYILHGKKDWMADTANAYFAQQKIVNADTYMHILDNTGHNVTRQHKELIKKLLLE